MLVGSIVLDHGGAFGNHGDDWATFDHKSFRITRIIDGDTVQIALAAQQEETVVRLIGIDALELDTGTTQPARTWARRAADYLAARTSNKPVVLRLEPTQTRDRHQRLLAYIYLSDSDCLNFDMIRDGLAYADRRYRHSFRPQFEMAEAEARKKQRGLWKDLTEDQMPQWRQDWLRKRAR